MVSFWYGRACVYLKYPFEKSICHILCNRMVSLRHEWPDVCLNLLFAKIVYHILHNDMVELRYGCEDGHLGVPML